MISHLSLLMVVLLTFSAQKKKKSMAYCLPLTPLRPMDMTIYRAECSRRQLEFHISIRLGELPDEWKILRVSPIPKSGELPYFITIHSKHLDLLLWGTSPNFFTAVKIHTWKVNYWSFTGCDWPLVQRAGTGTWHLHCILWLQ